MLIPCSFYLFLCFLSVVISRLSIYLFIYSCLCLYNRYFCYDQCYHSSIYIAYIFYCYFSSLSILIFSSSSIFFNLLFLVIPYLFCFLLFSLSIYFFHFCNTYILFLLPISFSYILSSLFVISFFIIPLSFSFASSSLFISPFTSSSSPLLSHPNPTSSPLSFIIFSLFSSSSFSFYFGILFDLLSPCLLYPSASLGPLLHPPSLFFLSFHLFLF